MDRAGVGRIAFALCLLTMASDAMPQTAGDSRSYRRDRRGSDGWRRRQREGLRIGPPR